MRLREKRAFYARFIVALPPELRVIDRVAVGTALRIALFGSSHSVPVTAEDIETARRFVAQVRSEGSREGGQGMSEKITRAQADAALEELEDLAVCGHNEEAASRHTIRNIASMVRAYLAQQPSDDVVRQAHEALDGLWDGYVTNRTLPDLGARRIKADFLASDARAALPPMPEEKAPGVEYLRSIDVPYAFGTKPSKEE